MKTYRIAIPATVGLSIVANSEAEAIAKANRFREEMTEVSGIEYMVIDEDEICGKSVAVHDVAVYLDDEVTEDHIEDIEGE